MGTRIELLPAGDVPAAQAVVDRMRPGSDNHPVLKDLRRDVFYGGLVWVVLGGDVPLALTCGKVGKRRKNVWEPYLNWYTAYTHPGYRRRGLAMELYLEMELHALKAGCRRVKSLAGSRAGLGLHKALNHDCWGLTPNNEVFVDSSLFGMSAHYNGYGAPPQAPGELMTPRELEKLIKKGLRYDTQA